MHVSPHDHIAGTLIKNGLRMRRSSLEGTEGALPWKLIEGVFAGEQNKQERPVEDPWDVVSHYYILTRHEQPIGGLRIVDPASFPHITIIRSRPTNNRHLPTGKEWSLDGKVVDVAGFFEGGRMVLASDSHHKGTFMIIIATVYLHALRMQKRRSESIQATRQRPKHSKSEQILPQAEAFYAPHFHYPDRPLLIRADDVPACYCRLFCEMEAAGLIEM